MVYGRAKREELVGAERLAAEQAGYLPVRHQAIKWFVIAFAPVIPLGTYQVLRARQQFWTTEPPRYAIRRVGWDWRQVAVHYLVAYGWLVLLIALVR